MKLFFILLAERGVVDGTSLDYLSRPYFIKNTFPIDYGQTCLLYCSNTTTPETHICTYTHLYTHALVYTQWPLELPSAFSQLMTPAHTQLRGSSVEISGCRLARGPIGRRVPVFCCFSSFSHLTRYYPFLTFTRNRYRISTCEG